MMRTKFSSTFDQFDHQGLYISVRTFRRDRGDTERDMLRGGGDNEI